MQHIVPMDELFAMSQKDTDESCKKDVCDTWQTADSMNCLQCEITTQTVNAVTSCAILCVQKTLKNAN